MFDLKMNTMRIFIPALLLLCASSVANAQLNEGGVPPSLVERTSVMAFPAFQTSLSGTGAELSVPVTFRVEALREEDARMRQAGGPARVGMILPYVVNVTEKGVWDTLGDGTKVCRLLLHVSGAKAVSLYYDRFNIPEGGKLFIYNKEKTHVLGAYTSASNPRGGRFATEYVAGEDIVMEYVAEENAGMPDIQVSEIGYGYNHLEVNKDAASYSNSYVKPDLGFHASDDDMVDINCSPEGDAWQNQKKGVAKIVYRLQNGQFYASGTLVNNTRQDKTLYWLTADHNFRGRVTADTFADMIFYFDNERKPDNWGTTVEPPSKTIVGAEYMYGDHLQGGTDVALLKITGTYDESYDFFWNGWDVADVPATHGVSIHHPKLDVKKISTFTEPAFTATWKSNEAVGKTDAHWGVNLVRTPNGFSLTEKGSDGGPLFNQEGKVVGVLTGKNIDYTESDTRTYYGKLAACWETVDPASGKSLSDYLDPDHTGVQSLEGRYQDGKPHAGFAASATAAYLSETIGFTDHSFGASTWAWEFPGAVPSESSEQHPAVTYTQPGTYDVKLTINKGTAEETEMSKEAYISIQEKADTVAEYVTVGNGTEVSPFPLGYESKQAFDVSLYAKEELGKSGNILSVGWQFSRPSIEPQTVYIYMMETEEASLASGTWANATASATLVYSGSDVPWQVEEDWCTFPLSVPFAYSGTKNLKIMVRTVAKQEPLASNECLYTEMDGMHMQWTYSRSGTPSSAGTVNANRPNVKIGFAESVATEAPVADFAPNPYISVFEADFEGEDFFLENGWTIENNGASDVQWKQWTYSMPFTTIDADSELSAVCLMDLSREVDSRMTTPLITLPENCTLEFYAGYSGSTTGAGLYLSADEGATWIELWTPGRLTDSGMPTVWRKQTFDLSEYAGGSILLSWHNKGKGVGAVAIDNLKIYHPSEASVVRVNEGDYVDFADRSSGPAVSWEWSFQGGVPSCSSEPDVRVQYPEAGTYDVSLTVRNGKGENTRSKTGIVVVEQQKPQTDFAGINGYQRKSNGGRFIPAGASLSFVDQSRHSPRTWAWAFPGAETGTSTEQSPSGILYPEEGEYAVSLETSNPTGGTDVLEKAGYVHVGGRDSVWNMPLGDAGNKVYTITAGYVTGTNRLMAGVADGYSERFERPLKPCELLSVGVQFFVEKEGTQGITVSICEDEFGLPGKVLATRELLAADMAESGYTSIAFDRPVGITKAFHVVFEGFNASNATEVDYALAICSSKNRTDGKGTACMKYFKDNFDGWMPMSQEYDYDLTLNVVPVLQYAAMEVSDTEMAATTQGGEAQEISVEGNVSWQASTDKMWITVENGTGMGNGSFNISCDENPGPRRTGIVTVEGGGIVRKVMVEQAGAAPANLTASVSDEKEVLLSWSAPSPAESVEYAEDVEAHAAFAVNSPGAMGWSYIDGDGDMTFSFADYNYPSESQPGAFVVFNPSRMTPNGESLSGIAAHSGSQYFACLNALSKETDDWLVSPELAYQEKFKFSFWAKTYDDEFGNERIQVAYSTTGKEKADFTQVVSDGNYEEVPTEWTQYVYVLPAEAKYVAIHCVSNQSFMLMVDDLYIGTECEAAAGHATETALLRWDNNMNMDGFGYDKETTFEVAVLFESGDLYAYHGGKLSAVEFYPCLQSEQEATASYTLKVRQGGELLWSKPVEEITYNQYNRIELDEPIAIDAAQPLSIGYEVHDLGGKYPAGYDMGPAVIGKGNLISTDGGYHFYPLTDERELDVNWNIAAVITPAEQPALSYHVYRDNVNIATVEQTAFTDEAVADGTYAYHVSALYGEDVESSPSNVCTVVVGGNSLSSEIAHELHVYPNVVGVNAVIHVVPGSNGLPEGMQVRILDMNGRTCTAVPLTGSTMLQAPSTPGVYFIQATDGKEMNLTTKLIVK